MTSFLRDESNSVIAQSVIILSPIFPSSPIPFIPFQPLPFLHLTSISSLLSLHLYSLCLAIVTHFLWCEDNRDSARKTGPRGEKLCPVKRKGTFTFAGVNIQKQRFMGELAWQSQTSWQTARLTIKKTQDFSGYLQSLSNYLKFFFHITFQCKL